MFPIDEIKARKEYLIQSNIHQTFKIDSDLIEIDVVSNKPRVYHKAICLEGAICNFLRTKRGRDYLLNYAIEIDAVNTELIKEIQDFAKTIKKQINGVTTGQSTKKNTNTKKE